MSNSQTPNFKTNYPNNEDTFLISTLVAACNSRRINFNARQNKIVDNVFVKSFQSFLLFKKFFQTVRKFWTLTGSCSGMSQELYK